MPASRSHSFLISDHSPDGACCPSLGTGSAAAMGFLENFFTYETPKSMVVKSWTVGVLNRLMQLLIIVYFLGWVFLHEKAYQTKETNIESSVITKVKGFGRAHFENGSVRVLDVADYIIPPQGSSVFCIITAMRITDNQLQTSVP
ncbi:P2X purinoceptor 3-like, partial [Mobula birostris]|uniref:P2X purinoceptor 3-like n=1 Tax=Mobula birostris TaxID=1983395 RepID=UPI003B27F63E